MKKIYNYFLRKKGRIAAVSLSLPSFKQATAGSQLYRLPLHCFKEKVLKVFFLLVSILLILCGVVIIPYALGGESIEKSVSLVSDNFALFIIGMLLIIIGCLCSFIAGLSFARQEEKPDVCQSCGAELDQEKVCSDCGAKAVTKRSFLNKSALIGSFIGLALIGAAGGAPFINVELKWVGIMFIAGIAESVFSVALSIIALALKKKGAGVAISALILGMLVCGFSLYLII